MKSKLPKLPGFCLALVVVSLMTAACGAPRPDARASSRPQSSPFSVAIEGQCPKLRVQTVGDQTLLVLGTYGLDEGGAWTGKQTAHAAQALAIVQNRTAKVNPSLLEGLPKTTTGWVEGDLEIGGAFPNSVWLERTLRDPAPPNKGALFEVSHDGFAWRGSAWRPDASSAGRDTFLRGPHTTLPTASLFCSNASTDDTIALSLLAAERTGDGTTFIAGRCEDELHRPTGPLLLGRFDVHTKRWERIATPPSVLFEGPEAIVNAGIVAVSPNEAWIYAYRPFAEKALAREGAQRERAYLVHFREADRDGGDWGSADSADRANTHAAAALMNVPFMRSIVSLTRAPDGSLWAVAGFAELHRMDARKGAWDPAPIALPPLHFVEPIPSHVRLLDVQAANKDVWVHGAIPIVRDDGSPGRTHVLYTTASWAAPLHCDRAQPPASALGPSTTKVKLAVLSRTPADPRDGNESSSK